MPDASGHAPGRPLGPYIVLTSLLIILLVVMNLLVLAVYRPNGKLGTHYYVAAGNSISFGYQPTLDFSHGFADDLETALRNEEITLKQTGKPAFTINLSNYACPGETTTTMIQGGCQFRNFLKEAYVCPPQPNCSQLDALVYFLNEHKGNVSPVTFELGADDVLPDFNSGSCSVPDQNQADADLQTMDGNLTRLDPNNPDDANDTNNGILPRLINALRVGPPLPVPGPGRGQVRLSGDLVLLNYYNPFAKACPSSVQFVHTLNDHLAHDAALFHIPVVDVYAAFGGDSGMATNICTYTWYCDRQDIHPTTAGYAIIEQAVQTALGYPNPLPAPASQGARPPSVAAYRRSLV